MKNAVKYLPDRKVLAGGLASVLAYLIVLALQESGVDIPYDIVAAAVGGAYALVSYLVPTPVRDVLRRGDDFVRQIGEAAGPPASAG